MTHFGTNLPAGLERSFGHSDFRSLGRNGFSVSPLALNGGGILRTHGRWQAAVGVISHALASGINLFVTAPGWAGSEDYLGEALAPHRQGVYIASQTHDRTRDGSLRLLETSLKRLRTSFLDLWMIQELRTVAQVDRVFSQGGAGDALREARDQGIVRSIGINGRFDPRVLRRALDQCDFDIVAFPVNAAENGQDSFAQSLLPAARQMGLGIIAQEATCDRRILDLGILSLGEALGHSLSQPGVGTVLIDCETVEDVDAHVRSLDGFQTFGIPMQKMLEQRTRSHQELLTYYKRSTEPSPT